MDERLGLSALSYPVPEHANTLPYMLGGITLFGFVILIATGIYLTQYYNPDPGQAHDSVVYIVQQASLGNFIRGIHYWTASLVTVTVLLHLIRVFFTGAYKRPREVNWLSGVGLLAIIVGSIFTGTILKWDQEAYEAMLHNMAFSQLLGGLGAWFSQSFTLSVPMLVRLYAVHIAVLPALLLILIAVHLMLVKYQGISPRPTAEARAGTRGKEGAGRFSAHLRRMSGYGLWLLALAGGLALIWPAPLGFAPVPGAEVTKPPWMFLWLYAFEDWIGTAALLWIPVALFVLLALVPFLDRSPYLAPRRRPVTLIVGVILLFLLIGLTLYVALTPPVSHIEMGGGA
ncbi:MAG: cytochrome b N-terminal domain-containing protein [Candidatus Bipolaricaulia bacterium]